VPGNLPPPARLPSERVVLPSPTSYPCCGGTLSKLGETITETLESIPRTGLCAISACHPAPGVASSTTGPG
jgi:transposase